MGVVWAVKESPELVLKWEKLIKTVLSRRMGPRRMGKVHQNPFTQELGGKARLVVTAWWQLRHGDTSIPALGQPQGPALGRSWEAPMQNWGADKARAPSHPEKQIKSSGSCSLWHKMVSAHHCQRAWIFLFHSGTRSCSQFCRFLKRKLTQSNAEVAWL